MREGFRATRVACYAGYRGEQEPRQFTVDERRLEVAEILDRWLDPEHRYFKVRCGSDRLFMLRHDEKSGAWEVRSLSGQAADRKSAASVPETD